MMTESIYELEFVLGNETVKTKVDAVIVAQPEGVRLAPPAAPPAVVQPRPLPRHRGSRPGPCRRHLPPRHRGRRHAHLPKSRPRALSRPSRTT